MRIIQAILFAFLLMLTFTYCDRQESLQDAIARAITQTSQVQSYRIMSNSTLHTDDFTQVSSSELEYAASDRYHLFETVNVEGGNATTTTMLDGGSVTVTTSGGCVWREIIVVGNKGYLRSSNEPQWRICEAFTSQTLENKLEISDYLVGLEVLPGEEIGGIGCSHYSGEVDQDSYVDMLMERSNETNGQIPPDIREWMLQREIIVELWIDGDEYIRQQRTEYRFPDLNVKEKWVSGFSITRYFDFNEPICIEPPEIESE
jgi:hypothetical protein